MKFRSNRNVTRYATRIFLLVPIWVSIASGIELEGKTATIEWLFIGFGALASLYVLMYRRRNEKYFAEVSGETITINSVKIERERIKKMEYWVRSSREHELRIDMEGFEEWKIFLSNEDVELEGVPLYKFIKNNFYPIRLVKV